MTTITIDIPDSNKSIISDISAIVKKAGLDIYISTDDNNAELKQAFHEAFDIIEGKTPRRTIRDVLNG